MSFTGTLDKCTACDKTVYVVDLLTLEGIPYHKNCFKCSHCKGCLTMCTYSSMDGILYCKTHFEQLFKESGNFSKNFGCPLTHSNYAALDGVLYCRVHFAQLFMEKGNYNHVLQAAAHRRTGSSTPPLLEEPSQEPAPPASHEDQTEEETPLE
ncbi:hypothetical protein JHK82_017796 [Glycine max]|nr:hypothetical protein JHK85_018255 [Glycine max]KAG5037020.1 hypothetical protein JHK86_017860 [Glycine max]KAG5142101.1 hypothetical protein JHK82_017796 [Glycine max]